MFSFKDSPMDDSTDSLIGARCFSLMNSSNVFWQSNKRCLLNDLAFTLVFG